MKSFARGGSCTKTANGKWYVYIEKYTSALHGTIFEIYDLLENLLKVTTAVLSRDIVTS